MDWQQTEVDLGSIKPNQSYTFNFLYKGNHKILTVEPQCGCTAVKADNNLINGTYNSGAFPSYAKQQGFTKLNIVKTIDVLTSDEKKHKLTIKAELHEL